MDPPTNILLRVCQVESAVGMGTAFTIEVDDRQYLVTARHVLPSDEPFSLRIRAHRSTHMLDGLRSVRGIPAEVDAAALRVEVPLSPRYELIPHSGGLVLGQEVFFFGFPYGMVATGPGEQQLPLVKRGFVSMLDSAEHPLYLDGFNNPGFSGGPVTFVHRRTNKLHVAGIISGYRFEPLPIMDAAGSPNAAAHYVQANSGIVVVAPIRYAVDAIRAAGAADASP